MTSKRVNANNAIYITADTGFDELEDILSTYDVCKNSSSYDLLQQAIIVNNPGAVTYLLTKGLASELLHPPCNEYLHLACKLNRDIIGKQIILVSLEFHSVGELSIITQL